MKKRYGEPADSGRIEARMKVAKGRRRHLALIAGGLLLVTGSALAAHEPAASVTEHDYLAELPIVLSVSRLSQSLNATPAAVTLIDRETIRSSGARDLADLFRLVPGFSVGLAPQAPYSVVYHGLTETEPRRMQVLIDGRSLFSAFYYGGINWNLIPLALDDIERIEVVRGSNSAAYGSNAFLGVANIITRSGAGVPRATLAASSGQGGIQDRLLRFAGHGAAYEYRLSASESRDEGIDFFRDNRQRRTFDLRADFRPTPGDEMSLRAGAAEVDLELGFPASFNNPARTQSRRLAFAQLDWRHALTPDSDLALRYVRTDERNRERAFFDLAAFRLPGQFVDADNGYRAVRDEFELSHTFAPVGGLRVVWGGGWRADVVEAPRFLAGAADNREHLSRLFGNVEWRPADAWTINFGVMHERNSLAGRSTSPRLMANLQATDALVLRAGVTKGYRAPSVFEKRGAEAFVSNTGIVIDRITVPNPRLQSEAIIARELGVLIRVPERRLDYDARIFDERVRGRIAPVPELIPPPDCELIGGSAPAGYCAFADRGENAQRVRLRGIEHRFDWKPFAGTRLTLAQAFVGAAADLDFPDGTQTPAVEGAATNTDRLAAFLVHAAHSAPTRSSSLQWIQQLPWNGELSVTYYSVGAMQFTTDANGRIAGYRRLDWRLSQRFAIGPTRGEAAFTVQGDGGDRFEYKRDLRLRSRGFLSLRLEY